MNETFGQRFYRLRRSCGYTQEDIANRVNVTPQAVSKWENDQSAPDIMILPKLADILHVSLDELLGNESKNNTQYQENYNENPMPNNVYQSHSAVNDAAKLVKQHWRKIYINCFISAAALFVFSGISFLMSSLFFKGVIENSPESQQGFIANGQKMFTLIPIVLCCISIVFLIVGLVLYFKDKKYQKDHPTEY